MRAPVQKHSVPSAGKNLGGEFSAARQGQAEPETGVVAESPGGRDLGIVVTDSDQLGGKLQEKPP